MELTFKKIYQATTDLARRLPPDSAARKALRVVKRKALAIKNFGQEIPGELRHAKSYLSYQRHQPLTIVVLGMHRSGTSCTTRIISLCGAHLGEQLLGENDYNPSGHWEHKYAISLNQKLLGYSGGAWDMPPPKVRLTFGSRIQMRRFLGLLHNQNKPAVWKDPRRSLTFPAWKPLLANYMPVVIFRHPMSVARSLEKRNQFPIEKGLRLWVAYNQRILDIVDSEDRVVFINFDGGVDHIRSRMKLLTQVASQLQYDPTAADFYDESLRTADDRTEIPSEDAKRIYDALRERTSET